MSENDIRRNGEHYLDLTAYHAIKNIERDKEEMEFFRGDIFRGDIFYIRKPNGAGNKGKQPVVVVTNDKINRGQFIGVVYLSLKKQSEHPWQTEIVCGGIATADCAFVQSVSRDRFECFARQCTDDEVRRIDDALIEGLGIGLKEAIAIGSGAPDIDPAPIESPLTDPIVIARFQEMIVPLETERDLYKKLYEDLIEKITR